ncbi:MAG TPA: hypothetical protein VFK04_05685, partial [Gemmatimonadaceae bacterium]|nr:hypothetical protein [Gemmatimonadaceae bacterium]
SVIIGDLDVRWTLIRPQKTDPILTVDPYAVLPSAITLERLEAVVRRKAEIAQPGHCIELIELTPGDFPQRLRTRPSRFSSVITIEDGFGAGIGERDDSHANISGSCLSRMAILHITYNDIRYISREETLPSGLARPAKLPQVARMTRTRVPFLLPAFRFLLSLP